MDSLSDPYYLVIFSLFNDSIHRQTTLKYKLHYRLDVELSTESKRQLLSRNDFPTLFQ